MALGSLSFAIGGCGPDCADTQPAIRYTGGTTDATRTTYMSSDWAGPFLHFPAGRQFDLIHELAAAPTTVDIYLSFKERIKQYEGRLAPASGNSTTFRVYDGFVQVRNDTCSEFYLLVVAKSDGADGGNASDAGDSGGD